MAKHKNKLVRRIFKGREDELEKMPAEEINEEAQRALRRSKRTWQRGMTFMCNKCKTNHNIWLNKENEEIYTNPDFTKYFLCRECRHDRSLASVLLMQGIKPWWKYNKEKSEKEVGK